MGQVERVLVVDDSPINVAVLEELLEDDYDVISVDSGEAALEAISACPPRVILMDVMMPGMNGLETCRAIRTHPEHADIKVVLISAWAGDEDIAQGLESGADCYLTKPVDHDALLEVMARLAPLD